MPTPGSTPSRIPLPARRPATRLLGTRLLAAALLVAALLAPAAHAGLMDMFKKYEPAITGGSGSATSLTRGEIVAGLKEALGKAVDESVAFLGAPGGFLDHAEVRIPMPDSLTTLERLARTAGQDALADEFVTSMNRAAERAVPEATALFTDAISRMTFADAEGILNGPDDAATRYFRRTSADDLAASFRPIVEQATDAVGVTSRYKELTASLGPVAGLAGTAQPPDLDAYVTGKAVDGLFTIIAREEKAIRENPAARTTELLEKVFGAGAR